MCVGYHSEADAPRKRLAKPLIFCQTESDCPMENGYAQPVEGIHVLVDMQNTMVIEFKDRLGKKCIFPQKDIHIIFVLLYAYHLSSYSFLLDSFLSAVNVWCYRDVIVWDTSSILTLTSKISLVEGKQLKIMYVCMKRTMKCSGNIKTGELA